MTTILIWYIKGKQIIKSGVTRAYHKYKYSCRYILSVTGPTMRLKRRFTLMAALKRFATLGLVMKKGFIRPNLYVTFRKSICCEILRLLHHFELNADTFIRSGAGFEIAVS